MGVKQKYNVLSINARETYDWLLKKHYAKRIPSISYSFGLYCQELLVGVLTIGKPASPTLCDGVCGADRSKLVYELNRLCVNDGLERNALSYFVSRSLNMISEGMVLISYADTDMGHHGYIYQATNWIYTGSTKERTDIGGKQGSHSRHYDKLTDKKQNRRRRSSKHRYVIFLGDEKKQLLAELKYPRLPYPKGDNERYDASHAPTVQLAML